MFWQSCTTKFSFFLHGRLSDMATLRVTVPPYLTILNVSGQVEQIQLRGDYLNMEVTRFILLVTYLVMQSHRQNFNIRSGLIATDCTSKVVTSQGVESSFAPYIIVCTWYFILIKITYYHRYFRKLLKSSITTNIKCWSTQLVTLLITGFYLVFVTYLEQ